MSVLIEVADPSQVATARRAATDLASVAGFNADQSGRVALIATEMGTNLLKHAARGHIVIDRFNDSSGSGVELVALDSAGGMYDWRSSMSEGTSTAGSLGSGLGVIQRQSDSFDIFSREGQGTTVVARVSSTVAQTDGGTGPVVGAISAPYPRETAIGDQWTYANTPAGPTIMLADGSGHGPQAEKAARTAVETFLAHAEEPCERLLERMHRSMAPTRGGAVSIARIDHQAALVRYAGVGNVAGTMVYGEKTSKMVSLNGIVGHVASRIREFTYPFQGPTMVILHSDGLTGRWDLNSYPGLAMSHPTAVAGVLFRDFRRDRDDASVVVLRG